MADTIKTLSDHSVDATLLLVGVASSVSELIKAHESIDRALIQIRVPRMPIQELGQIIDNGIERIDMTFDETVRGKITRLSHGLPHYTHLLALNSGVAAVNRDSKQITDEDFGTAVKGVIRDKHTVTDRYYKAVSSSQAGSKYEQVLLACALCTTDGQGYFNAKGVAEAMAVLKNIDKEDCKVSDFQRHLNDFISEKRGNVLERRGKMRSYRYRFSNPLLQPYTIIHCLSQGLLTESKLWLMDQPYYG